MKLSRVLSLSLFVFFCGLVAADAQMVSGLDQRAARTIGSPGKPLTSPSASAPGVVVRDYLRAGGAGGATVGSLVETEQRRVSANGVTHIRYEQRIDGLSVHGAYVKAAVNARGELLQLIENLVAVSGAPVAAAAIRERQALGVALAHLHPDARVELNELSRSGNAVRYSRGSFFHADPEVTRVVVVLAGGRLAQGYRVETWTEAGNQLHHTVVGGDGSVLAVESRTANDSYRVFVEDPLKGPQTVISGPGAGNAESPIGWLGGTQTTVNLRGNNVAAYLDSDANNRPDRGGTAVTTGDFLATVDLTVQPTTAENRAVAVQNLFYLNNVAHDILYNLGFTEAAGNFQLDNFGKGGAGKDPVKAEAQDGSGLDNANFATPADGQSPRMQMFLWSGPGPSHQVVVSAPSPGLYGASGAQFGPALTVTGVTGPVVVVNDGVGSGGDGCETLTQDLRGRIAIIDRGTCNFTVKVLNAQGAGAIAVIVANNQGATETFTMGGTERRVRIPSVMVSQNDGALLKSMTGLNVTLRANPNPPPRIDASLDADIVFHEYGHGLTWRMIGGMSGPLAGAIGEGASDVLAFLVNGDDRIGEYSFTNEGGIRRYPYSGYPLRYGDVQGLEVHNDGEIYAAAMWRTRELFEAAGLGVQDLLFHFVDGMNYTPVTPAFEHMRDGMLLSVAARGGASAAPARCAIWTAFAEYGIGEGATGVVNGSSVTITPSFLVPAGACPP